MPATDLRNISATKNTGAITVELNQTSFYLQEPTRARNNKSSDWRGDLLFVAYWWVATTSDKSEANLVEKKIQDKESGLMVPMLVNSRPLKAHEKLMLFKAKKVAVPLSTAKSASTDKQAKRQKM